VFQGLKRLEYVDLSENRLQVEKIWTLLHGVWAVKAPEKDQTSDSTPSSKSNFNEAHLVSRTQAASFKNLH